MTEKADTVADRIIDDQLADVADAIISVARKLALRSQDVREIVPLTGTEAEVVREITRNPGTNPTQIAAATGLRRSNVSAAVRVLESRDLITRQQRAEDARYVQLVTTEFGLENLRKIRALWARRLRTAPTELVEQAAALHDVLISLDRSLAR
ncbi:MarR family winged helix-turn-helix transcriptional regulator [Nocardia vaccinii]|uniref:MarR family winged helix-turn-helix transcriptional regulator n=1 Tax=Nocardia vaccinii TaxID=1822 RepID=UPI0014712E4F|nr:helix-turn-helix domain-containing protein [Nocardia vaccinii]